MIAELESTRLPTAWKRQPAFVRWELKLCELYAERDAVRPRHSSMNVRPIEVNPQTPDAAQALKLARRYARQVVSRVDDEVESATNDAVQIAIEKWQPDGEATFQTYLCRCVFNCVKRCEQKHARRTRRETREIDRGLEYAR